MARPTTPREPLRTSQQAHARIRWDERLARRPFTLIIDDRPAGTRALPFGAFVPDGDIPWHRIRQITLQGSPVWCRERRLDLLDEVAHWPDTSAPVRPRPAAPAVAPAGLAPLAPRVAPHPHGTSVYPARVATLNALTDAHDADLIASERRWPEVVARLGELDADLIGLSEVTPELAALLDRAPWAAGYDRSDDGDLSVRPHGQMLLSRWPIRSAGLLALTPTRRVLCCDVDAPTGPLRVLVAHLASNATKGAPELRREELARSLALLAGGEDALVMGDLNLTGDELAGPLAAAGLTDAWAQLLPDDPGLTYDPSANALAALFSRDGRGKRYDRILWRGNALSPCAARLFATAPVGAGDAGLFPSDHFGVVVDLRVGDEPGALDRAAPTYHSALALVPPPSLWAAIEPLRAAHDRGFGRWLPHVTLLHGFAPAALHGEALGRVQRACRAVEPFEVTLAACGRFDHDGSRTVWLDPRGDGALARLHEALQREFPRLGEPGRGFTPHLTVARFPSGHAAEAERFERALRRDWRPAPWRVEAVHLLARRGDRPVESLVRVDLGAGTARGGVGVPGEREAWRLLAPPASPARRERRARALAAVEDAARALAAARGLPAPRVEPVGSSRYCPDLPDGDLDLLLHAPCGLDAPAALSALDGELGSRGVERRRVDGAHVAAVRARLDGVEVDLTAAESRAPGEPPPAGALDARALDALPAAEQRAVLAAHDAAEIERIVGDRREAFGELLRLVRRWTGARALRGQWAGYPGGLSWAVLAARACLDHPGLTGGALLSAFLAGEAERPWPACVSLAPVDEARWLPATDTLAILAPARPWRDTARGLTGPTARALRDELRRASALVSAVARHRAAAGELFTPVALEGPRLDVSVAGTAAERVARRGQAAGSLLALVRALSSAGLTPRPLARWQPGAASDRLTVLLDAADGALAPATAWTADLAGVSVTLLT